MSIVSFFDLFANKIVSFFDEPEFDRKNYEKKLSKLEKKIYSQGEFTTKKYRDFLTTFDDSAFKIADFAIKESLKSRIGRNSDLYTLNELLSDREIDYSIDHHRLNATVLQLIEAGEYLGSDGIDIASLFISFVQDIRHRLQGKRIGKLLTSFFSNKHHSLNLLHLQIPIIHSFLAFFDQLFALKDVEQNSSFESNILFYVNIKNSNNEARRIDRVVPAFSGT